LAELIDLKKIIFAVTNDLVHDQRMHRICSTLQANNYSVTLVGRKRRNSQTLDKLNYNQVRLKCWFNKGKLFYLEYNFRLLFHLLSNSSGGICSVDLDTLLACGIASRFKNNKLIFDAHELFTEVPELNNRPRSKAIWKWIGKKFIKQSHARYTVSEAVAKRLQELYGKSFQLIKNVPSLQKAPTPAPRFKTKTLYYQGALNIGRGLELVLQALANELHEYKFWIAGEGDITQELKKLTKDLDLENRVTFFGTLPLKEMQDKMTKVSIGLNLLDASISESYKVSLANKTFDYMHGKLPAIHMDFPEYRKLYNEHNCCFLLASYKASEFAACVKNISESQWSLAKQNCIGASQAYNWDNESTELINIYDNLFIQK